MCKTTGKKIHETKKNAILLWRIFYELYHFMIKMIRHGLKKDSFFNLQIDSYNKRDFIIEKQLPR